MIGSGTILAGCGGETDRRILKQVRRYRPAFVPGDRCARYRIRR
ncbi:MAG: hypothetical protein OXC09_08500 [Truepera sp.]|nr:hypothetical protein [Truepera sp.]